jgi:hypothetical protein
LVVFALTVPRIPRITDLKFYKNRKSNNIEWY